MKSIDKNQIEKEKNNLKSFECLPSGKLIKFASDNQMSYKQLHNAPNFLNSLN
jgi:hypothetical protein